MFDGIAADCCDGGLIQDRIAHRSEDGRVQMLADHLLSVSELCGSFSSIFDLENTGRLVGLLHDLGKYSDRFQSYIRGKTDYRRGDVDHSTAGAQYLHRFEPELSKENAFEYWSFQIMEFVILSHHSGLINGYAQDGTNVYLNRIEKDGTDLDNCISNSDSTVLSDAQRLIPLAVSELSAKLRDIQTEISSKCNKNECRSSLFFAVGLLSRIILSCLIDADFSDTSSFEENRPYERAESDWLPLLNTLESYISSLDVRSPIDGIRRNISDECAAASVRRPGIFTLSVPTGGGKTLSSLRFSISHAIRHGMRRIIYVAPYLSIIDQNVSSVRNALGIDETSDLITECHSGIDVQSATDCDSERISERTSDTWESPLVFTTFVQFADTLFGSGTKKARRLHNLAGSVIIFDEIQTIPVKLVSMFNESLSFLTDFMHSSAVLCTATQPLLGGPIPHRLRFGPEPEIICDVDGLSHALRRTDVRLVNAGSPLADSNRMADFALDLLETSDSILVIVNTKRMARDIYLNLRERVSEDVCLYHLSTDMCAAHRSLVISEIKEKLVCDRVICVSTQLIEAGIDIDFHSVLRSMAGLDSIAQAAGRCNRNGNMEIGHVWVMDTSENIGSLKDISIGRECARLSFSRHPDDVISIDSMNDYFQRYFYQRADEMCYPTDNPDSTLFDMLSDNRAAEINSRRSASGPSVPVLMLPQSFRDANRIFAVIESQISLIVPYNEDARNIIAEISDRGCESDIRRSMHRIQKYSVNTFRFDHMLKKGMVYELIPNSGIYCLKDGYYDMHLGVVECFCGDVMLI